MSTEQDWAEKESKRLLPCRQTIIHGVSCPEDHFDDCPARYRPSIETALRKAAANERALTQAEITATRLIGQSVNGSDYQAGFADACDNIEHRIRQRGEGDERK